MRYKKLVQKRLTGWGGPDRLRWSSWVPQTRSSPSPPDLPSRVSLASVNHTTITSTVRLERSGEFCPNSLYICQQTQAVWKNCFTQIPAEFRTEQEPNVSFFPTFCCTLCGKWKPAPRFVQLFRNPHSHLWLQLPASMGGQFLSSTGSISLKKQQLAHFPPRTWNPTHTRLSQGEL